MIFIEKKQSARQFNSTVQYSTVQYSTVNGKVYCIKFSVQFVVEEAGRIVFLREYKPL